MRFSRSIKSSAHSLPSPNGTITATIHPSKLVLRLTRSLEVLRTIPLPESFSTSIQSFSWSSASNRILIASANCIKVYSIANPKFSANITNPISETAKITHIAFGETEEEIVVFSDFGLKATVFKLSSSTSIDLVTPKLFTAGTASKGFSYRPNSLHCTLLSRSAGKDIISIHEKDSYAILRSWRPDTIDAQAISWSPDGKWLAVIESSGQGHKIVFYTADGHSFKVWHGPTSVSAEDKDLGMGAGVKLLEWNALGDFVAVSDHSGRVTIISVPGFSSSMSLNHTTTIRPAKGLKIWQEQIIPSQTGGLERAYSLASQITAPPTTENSPLSEAGSKIGINLLSIDASGTLIATRTENMPTTIWIWDIASRILKTVLIQHAPIARVSWHPHINELLLIRCEGDDSRGLAYLWEPSWEAPKMVDFASRVPEGKLMGRTIVRWLPCASSVPAIFFSDVQDFMLAAVSDDDEAEVPWQNEAPQAVDNHGEREESPLDLVQADEKRPGDHMMDSFTEEEMAEWVDNDMTEIDDTFSFRKMG